MANQEITSSLRFTEENMHFQMKMMDKLLSKHYPYKYKLAEAGIFVVWDRNEHMTIKKIVISSKTVYISLEYKFFKFLFQYSRFSNLYCNFG